MARILVCTVAGCGKPAKDGGHCSSHANRRRRYGDPTHKVPPRTKPPCTIAGCDNPNYGHGYCVPHYKRWRKYGNPLGGYTPNGSVRKWIDTVAIPHVGDGCLPFPYCRDANGYGRINVDGTTIGAHVFVLQQTKGPRPTAGHESCHTCGNGHEGCVSPSHLYWGTRADNVADALRHGSVLGKPRYGSDHHAFSTTSEIVAWVRKDLASGATQTSTAEKYGISQAQVSRIKLRAGRFSQ
jgi:hypothetical protein